MTDIESRLCLYQISFCIVPLHHVYISDTVVDAAMMVHIKSNHVYIVPLISCSHHRHCRYINDWRHRFLHRISLISCLRFDIIDTSQCWSTSSRHHVYIVHKFDIVSISYSFFLVYIVDIEMLIDVVSICFISFTSSTSQCGPTSSRHCDSHFANIVHVNKKVQTKCQSIQWQFVWTN